MTAVLIGQDPTSRGRTPNWRRCSAERLLKFRYSADCPVLLSLGHPWECEYLQHGVRSFSSINRRVWPGTVVQWKMRRMVRISPGKNRSTSERESEAFPSNPLGNTLQQEVRRLKEVAAAFHIFFTANSDTKTPRIKLNVDLFSVRPTGRILFCFYSTNLAILHCALRSSPGPYK